MTRTTTIAVVLVVAAAACSKDRTDRGAGDEAKAAEAAKGVAVVSANELGPQPRKTVSVTTRSAM